MVRLTQRVNSINAISKITLIGLLLAFAFSVVSSPRVHAAEPTVSQMRSTISAKCAKTNVVQTKSNANGVHICQGTGKWGDKPNQKPQLAKRLRDLCSMTKLLKDGRAYTTVGSVKKGNCAAIIRDADIRKLAAKAKVKGCRSPGFFSLPTWYKYLGREVDPTTNKCEVRFSLFVYGDAGREFSGVGLLLIALSVVDMLLRIAALASVAFVIFGGIKYTTSQGSPDATKAAQSTILNALVGLVIAMVATAVVMFIGNTVK